MPPRERVAPSKAASRTRGNRNRQMMSCISPLCSPSERLWITAEKRRPVDPADIPRNSVPTNRTAATHEAAAIRPDMEVAVVTADP
jgi:hypothetical protein